jgi:hypothetical protein
MFYAQAHFFGYEGRCAIPTNFDSSYCYSLGMTATALVREGATGYMSCIMNLKDQDPSNWIAAGCPLPTMMHLERRKGKDVPVIKKALVDLDGDMFKSYVAVREKWSYLDCFRSPGPIQFAGSNSHKIPFLVSPPVIADLLKETEDHEKQELSKTGSIHTSSNLSDLSKSRILEKSTIPDTLESNSYSLVGVKKAKAFSELVKLKTSEQFPILKDSVDANYFVEVQDRLMLVNDHLKYEDQTL